MISKKRVKEAEEVQDVEEQLDNLSENRLDRDFETIKSPLYSSEEMPNDLYQYKRMRLIPNAETEFPGLVDKDMVLANVGNKKPDPQYLRFIAETIEALKIFSLKKKIKIRVKNDKGIVSEREQEIFVADSEFDIIRSFLRASLKADLTLSRAMGDKREAVIDRSQFVGKEISKGNQKNKYEG